MPKAHEPSCERHPAGEGFAVTFVQGTRTMRPRYDVCAECPWRLDRPTGTFPAEAFRLSAATARDGAFEQFACHMSRTAAPRICAGFLAAQGKHNVGTRIDQAFDAFDPSQLALSAPTYVSYRAMALANGVAPNDPCLVGLRDDGQFAGAIRPSDAS